MLSVLKSRQLEVEFVAKNVGGVLTFLPLKSELIGLK